MLFGPVSPTRSPVSTGWLRGESRGKHTGKTTGHQRPALVAGMGFSSVKDPAYVLVDLCIQQLLLCAGYTTGHQVIMTSRGQKAVGTLSSCPSHRPLLQLENLTIFDASLKRPRMTTGFVSVTGHRHECEMKRPKHGIKQTAHSFKRLTN